MLIWTLLAGLAARPGAPRQFIPSFIRPVWAESVLGAGERVAPRGDSCFVDTATLRFPASLLVLPGDRPRTLSLRTCALLEKNPP